MPQTVHGTAVLAGAHGVLIRGGSGAGKSMLALALIERGARLIGDDRLTLSARNGRVLASAPASAAGLIELRGRGIVARPHERAGVIRLVVDIVSGEELERMPEEHQLTATLLDMALPRQPVPAETEPAIRLVNEALAGLSQPGNMGLRSA